MNFIAASTNQFSFFSSNPEQHSFRVWYICDSLSFMFCQNICRIIERFLFLTARLITCAVSLLDFALGLSDNLRYCTKILWLWSNGFDPGKSFSDIKKNHPNNIICPGILLSCKRGIQHKWESKEFVNRFTCLRQCTYLSVVLNSNMYYIYYIKANVSTSPKDLFLDYFLQFSCACMYLIINHCTCLYSASLLIV